MSTLVDEHFVQCGSSSVWATSLFIMWEKIKITLEPKYNLVNHPNHAHLLEIRLMTTVNVQALPWTGTWRCSLVLWVLKDVSGPVMYCWFAGLLNSTDYSCIVALNQWRQRWTTSFPSSLYVVIRSSVGWYLTNLMHAKKTSSPGRFLAYSVHQRTVAFVTHLQSLPEERPATLIKQRYHSN